MSDPLDKMWNEDSLTPEVAEALRRWERRAGVYARVQRHGMQAFKDAFEGFEGVEHLQVTTPHGESSREEQKERNYLRNEEMVVWVGQTIKEIKIFQKRHAAATGDEKREIENSLLVRYNAKPSAKARDVAFSEASLLWSVGEKTIQNIFDSPEFREARDRASPFSTPYSRSRMMFEKLSHPTFP